MSIIYQALEKLEQGKDISSTQNTRNKILIKSNLAPEKKPKIVYAIAGILSTFLILGIAYMAISHLQEKSPDIQNSEKTEDIQPEGVNLLQRSTVLSSIKGIEEKFSLTGITQVKNEMTAIINNQLVRVGSSVNGAKVMAINDEEVILEFNGDPIALSLY